MSARARMRHRAVIERDGAVGGDDWNQAPAPEWAAHLTDLPCFAWYAPRRNGTEVIDGAKSAARGDWRMIVPLGTDVKTSDRVASVATKAGSEVLGAAEIRAIGNRTDHILLTLERISSDG